MPQDPWAAFVAVIGAIIVILNIIDRIISFKDRAKAPGAAQDAKIANMELQIAEINRTLNKHKEFFDNDNKRIDSIVSESRTVNKIMIKSLNALTEHALNGNNLEQLRSCSKEMDDYLINR